MKKWNIPGAGAQGCARGPAFLMTRASLEADTSAIARLDVQRECAHFEEAVHTVCADLHPLTRRHEIFAAHMALAEDEELHDEVVRHVTYDLINASFAVKIVAKQYIDLFQHMEDAYMRERAADIKDVARRILCALNGVDDDPFAAMKTPGIAVAEELLPSDIVRAPRALVRGLLSEKGSVLSHAAMLAAAEGIPCMPGAARILEHVQTGMEIFMDTEAGEVILEPEAAI